jgi:CheY-like chemotaxis protein
LRRVRLIHWDPAEARQRADQLREAGYRVECDTFTPKFLHERENPPNAIIIDLSWLPSQGRDVGMALRSSKLTRTIPLIFVGGKPEKVERIRGQMPDAFYSDWDRITEGLQHVIGGPPEEPPRTRSRLEGYADAPLQKKLGIKPGITISLVGAPREFQEILGDLPKDVVLRDGLRSGSNLTLWFAKSRRELEERVQRMKPFSKNAGLWILWPKRASGVQSDLGQPIVREAGLAAGMVDFKICSIDKTWSGLRFTLREK